MSPAPDHRSRFGTTARGVTLIELLVVLAILGVVLAISVPALDSARQSGRRTVCLSNLRQLALAAGQYVSTYNRFPLTEMISDIDLGGVGQPTHFANWSAGQSLPAIFRCPNHMDGDETPTPGPNRSSYVFEPARLMQDQSTLDPHRLPAAEREGTGNPSEFVFYFESSANSANTPVQPLFQDVYPQHLSLSRRLTSGAASASGIGGRNGSFLDGSCRPLTP